MSKSIISKFGFFFLIASFVTACTNPVAQFRKVATTPTFNATGNQPTDEDPVEEPTEESDPNPVPMPQPTPEEPAPTPVVPPVTPPVVVPPPVTPPPVIKPMPIQKAGTCASDSSTTLLSCLRCEIPVNPPPPPQFSEKGQSFIDIMAIGCSVSNRSAPKDYVAPSREELITRLNRLSPSLYPDSVKSSQQQQVIHSLLNDPSTQQRVFGGTWYQPPYSTAFETYFGVSVGEAVYNICYNSTNSTFTPNNSSEVHSKEYLDCTYTVGNGCREKAEYVQANHYRNQLRQAMKESVRNPYVKPQPTPAKKCYWESFSGNYEDGAEKVLRKWLKAGYKVGIEIRSLAGRCEAVTSVPVDSNIPRGDVKLSGYYCQ